MCMYTLQCVKRQQQPKNQACRLLLDLSLWTWFNQQQTLVTCNVKTLSLHPSDLLDCVLTSPAGLDPQAKICHVNQTPIEAIERLLYCI